MLFGNVLAGLGLAVSTATAVKVDIQDHGSIKKAASTAAYGLMKFYHGNETGDVPGNVPEPYYWWICGGMLGHLIDYWHYTGDKTYNDVVTQALLHQVGNDKDFMPHNQTMDMGNDDQGYWAMTAMTAAERVFPNPPKDQPQWLALVQAVFNEFVSRWEPKDCKGGMRWQVFNFNAGWDYKNTVSNGCFFNIAARLASYTGNETYAHWAEKVWDWETDLGLITPDTWQVKDGVHIKDCNKVDQNEWSYNSGAMLHGAATMYDFSNDNKWKDRAEGILNHGLTKFVKQNVIYEQRCELGKVCDDDQRTFKGYYIRALSTTAQIMPAFAGKVEPLLKSTAEAAAGACSGTPEAPTPNAQYPMFEGQPGTACGFQWVPQSKFDGNSGIPEQMNALAALTYVLPSKPPVSKKTGGTSKGDPSAGGNDEDKTRTFKPVTTGDRVGAGILTTITLAGLIGGCSFIVIG